MPTPSRLLLSSLLTLLAACDPTDAEIVEAGVDAIGPAAATGHTAVTFHNALGETITGVLNVPAGRDVVPGVVVLHGSGGLFRPPDDPAAFNPATADMERQFREWEALLTDAGYAVLLPASFYSRGSFDWNDDPLPGVDEAERLRLRVHDAFAALDYLCAHPRVDCARTAIIGFSNGASALLLADYVRIADMPAFADAEPHWPIIGVAYGPGCGLQGFVRLNEGDYEPRGPLLMLHGGNDALLQNCYARVEQAAALGQPIEHRVWPGASHDFDGYPENALEERARDEGRAFVLGRLRDVLRP